MTWVGEGKGKKGNQGDGLKGDWNGTCWSLGLSKGTLQDQLICLFESSHLLALLMVLCWFGHSNSGFLDLLVVCLASVPYLIPSSTNDTER